MTMRPGKVNFNIEDSGTMSDPFRPETADMAITGGLPQGTNPGGPGKTGRGRNRRRFPRRAHRGISIFPVILGIAVAAVAISYLVSVYQGALTNTRTQTTLNTVLIMDTSIRRSYANLPQFEANLTGGLWSAVPASAIQGTGNNRRIVTPWGGQIFAGGGDAPGDNGTGSASNNRFYISILGLPEDACETIAAAFLNRSDVVGLDVEGTAAASFTRVNTTAQIQAFDTVSEINTACDGGDDDKIGIVFRG